jgi:hypothetical protein
MGRVAVRINPLYNTLSPPRLAPANPRITRPSQVIETLPEDDVKFLKATLPRLALSHHFGSVSIQMLSAVQQSRMDKYGLRCRRQHPDEHINTDFGPNPSADLRLLFYVHTYDFL